MTRWTREDALVAQSALEAFDQGGGLEAVLDTLVAPSMRYAEALGEILGQPWLREMGRDGVMYLCPGCTADLGDGEAHGPGCAWLIAAKAGGVL